MSLTGFNSYNKNISNTNSFNDGLGTNISNGQITTNTVTTTNLYVNGQQITRAALDGQGFTFKGVYNASTTYYPYDVITYNGSCYNCILQSINYLPTNTLYFSIIAQKGDTGNSGTNGQGFNFTNNYNNSTTYNPYDVLTYNNSTYICISSSSGNLPDTSTNFVCIARGLCWKGNYTGTPTTYDVNDVVLYSDGNTYICILQTPYPGGYHCSNTTYWNLFVQQGQQGPQGATGATGDSGLDAFFTILGLSGSIASSLTTIATVNSSLASMQSEIDGFSGTLTTLQGEVNTLDTQVSTLQQKTQYQTANNTTPTTNFASDILVTDSTGITTKINLAQDGSITAGSISGTTLSSSSSYNLGNSSTNTNTNYLDGNVLNIGTRHNSNVNIGSASSFSSIEITGLTIDLTGIVTINGIPFYNAGISFPNGIDQGY